MGKDRLHKGRGWEYFNGFEGGLETRAIDFITKEYAKVKKLREAGSRDEVNALIPRIEGAIAMAINLGLMTKKQAERIDHDQYFKSQKQG